MRKLKVRTSDNTMRTLLVEDSNTVEQLMYIICKSIGIPNNQEYSLARTNDVTYKALTDKKMETLKAKLHLEDEGNQEKQITSLSEMCHTLCVTSPSGLYFFLPCGT